MQIRAKLSIGIVIGALAALLPVGSSLVQASPKDLFDHPCTSGGNVTGDFNGDDFPDVAIGAPGDDLEQTEVDGSITQGFADAGSINIIYSDGSGLNPKIRPGGSPLYLSQNTPNVDGTAEAGDAFGSSMAVGDFNGDDFDDLAVGAPGEDAGRGLVQIFYSDGAGLDVGLNDFFIQGTAGDDVNDTGENGDLFGYALATGDIDQDGTDDLIIGVPGEDFSIGSPSRSVTDGGVIQIIYGSDDGLQPDEDDGEQDDELFNEGNGSTSQPEKARADNGDGFGAALAVGQLDDNDEPDIAVGIPAEDVGSAADAGAVKVFYTDGEVDTDEVDFFSQATTALDGIPDPGDRFGCSLVTGDFDGDSTPDFADDDLALGTPGEDVEADDNAGVVQVLYNTGSDEGLEVVDPDDPEDFWTEDQVWTEDDGGVPGVAKPDDRMGSSLAVADFNGDDVDDLAIGLPTELLFTDARAGSIRVLFGFAGFGVTDSSPAAFAQAPSTLPEDCLLMGLLYDLGLGVGTPAVAGLPDLGTIPGLDTLIDLPCLFGPEDYSPTFLIEEEGDLFGASIAAADFDNNGFADLSVGAPGEDLGTFINWLTEEEANVPDDILEQLGIPLPLDLDEADDAGVIHVLDGPFVVPTNVPNSQDLIYRGSDDSLQALRDVLHQLLGPGGLLPLLHDNRILTPTDPSWSGILTGDGFGSDQS